MWSLPFRVIFRFSKTCFASFGRFRQPARTWRGKIGRGLTVDVISLVLVLMLAVVASGGLARLSPFPVPLPLVQIALGAALSSFSDLGVTLDPTIFFMLFLPPLLFLDGWRIPKEGLFRDIGTIINLALGLVVFTVLGMGFLIHWLIPAMPLPVAFALAAILSPTDPVAVAAVASRMPMPRRVMHLLQGEALLNDASGLVCMRFAVAAAMTGAFSLADASLVFLWLAAAGILTGILVTWAVTWTKSRVMRRFGEEPGSQILISLLIPFAAYVLAERIGASGILAAVAAGMTMSYSEQSGQALAVTRIRRSAVWDMVAFTLNGVMFVLLGEQLPRIVDGAAQVVRETGHHDPLWMVVYVLVINVALAVLRFLWVWVSLTLSRIAVPGRDLPAPGWRLVAAISVGGARGAVTLAGVLTLPLLLPDGAAFPARDLAIFLAAGAIIISLVAASLLLPVLMTGLEVPPEPREQRDEDRARIAAAEAAIRAVSEAQALAARDPAAAPVYADAATRVIEVYRQRIKGMTAEDEATDDAHRRARRIEGELWLVGLQAERDAIYGAARHRGLSDETARRLVREVDLVEARLAG